MSDLIREGNYKGRGFGTPELGLTTEKKSEYLRVTVQIKGGEFDGRFVSRNYFFSEKALPYTLEALRLLGCTFPNNDITDYTGFGANDVDFTVKHEMSQPKDGSEPKPYAQIGFINKPFGISEEARMSDQQKAIFKQKMMGTLAATASKNGAPTTQTSKAPF
jgi:hypothetical protein